MDTGSVADRLEQWRAKAVITETQYAVLSALVRRERFSVFVELSALLYLGVLFAVGGLIVGDDVVKRVVNVGDIIIIPAGTPHGWADIPDHVDYLSVRPDPQRTIPELYTNPALKKQ